MVRDGAVVIVAAVTVLKGCGVIQGEIDARIYTIYVAICVTICTSRSAIVQRSCWCLA